MPQYQYPGLGLPLRHHDHVDKGPFYPIGAHQSCTGAISDILPVREVAMMSIMENLTDKDEWDKKVFDDEIVAKWRREALALPNQHFWRLATGDKSQRYNEDGSVIVEDHQNLQYLKPLEGIMTEAVFDSCVRELQRKAVYYAETGIIPTLDASASMAKSDKLVTPPLHQRLRDAFETLQKDQAEMPDWHPNSNDMVQDLVHPSMYPLVYGRSKALKEELVGVEDAIDKWAGKGDVIEKHIFPSRIYRVGDGIPPDYWSNTYQWLPANVSFQVDGSVKFTSYINNLSPTKYPQIYRTIEKLIDVTLPAWDQCLVLHTKEGTREGAGRMNSRFFTTMPDNKDDENMELWDPSDPQVTADATISWDEMRNTIRVDLDPRYDDETECKWLYLRKPKIPEPANEDIDYAPGCARLVDRFRESGLQVIVKMASIELTPDKPEFSMGGWHVEGQMNEHICATALYYLDSENITSRSLSFRMQTPENLHEDERYLAGQGTFHWMEQIYGTTLEYDSSPCLQNYGSVETREGRLLAFPNVFQHRVSPFKLTDPTKPGHRRFIALWLVDPNIRIISTANVPPQQLSWWREAILGTGPEQRNAALCKFPYEVISLIADTVKDVDPGKGVAAKLPPELMEMVREYWTKDRNQLLMSSEEAKEHRLELMEERSHFVKKSEEDCTAERYNFCEH